MRSIKTEFARAWQELRLYHKHGAGTSLAGDEMIVDPITGDYKILKADPPIHHAASFAAQRCWEARQDKMAKYLPGNVTLACALSFSSPNFFGQTKKEQAEDNLDFARTLARAVKWRYSRSRRNAP